MEKLEIIYNLKRNLIEWDDATVPTKELGNVSSKPNLANRDIPKVAMHTANKAPNNEETDRIVNILDSTYKRDNIDNVASNTTWLNY